MSIYPNFSLARQIKSKKARMVLSRSALALGVEIVVFDQQGHVFMTQPDGSVDTSALNPVAVARVGQFNANDGQPIFEDGGCWAPVLTRQGAVGTVFCRNFKIGDAQMQQNQTQMVSEAISYMLDEEFRLKDLSSQLIDTYEELNLLYEIGRTVSSIRDIAKVKEKIVSESVEIINARNGFLIIEDEKSGLYQIANIYDDSILDAAGVDMALAVDIHKDIIHQVLTDGESKIVLDQPSAIFFQNSDKTIVIQSALCAPLQTSSQIIGVLLLINKDGDEIFTTGDRKLLTAMASQAAQSIENATLFQKLEYEKNMVERIIETTADGIIVATDSGEITRFNQEARYIFGFTENRIPTKEDIAKNSRLSLMMKKISTRKDNSGVFEMIIMKPLKLFLSIHTNPLFDPAQKSFGLVASIRNLTDVKKAEREKREVVSLLAQKLPTLSEEIVSLVIHEPRKAAADSHKDGIIKADQLGTLAVDLDRRITRLRRFLQIIAGPLRIERVETPVSELIKTMVDNFQAAAPNKATFDVQVADNVGVLKIDKDHFGEFIEILIENVYDHAGEDVSVSIKLWREKEYLLGEFSDNGKGVSDYLQSLLFEPTIQLVEHEELRLDEIGLGLPYGKHVVDGHGGDISISKSSADGRGCVVKFRIHIGSQE